MTVKEKQHYATENFAGNLNCAQSVLSAYCEELGIPPETAEKMGSAFGAGMGEGTICGAVSGALMVLGLKYGKSDISPSEKEKMKEVFEKFKRRFESIHGTLTCKQLLNLDLREEDDYQKAHNLLVFENSCPAFIKTAIALIEEIDD